MCVWGGGGYSDSFIYTLAQAIFWGSKILNFNTFVGFQKRKMNIFGGMKILWIFFGVITKFDYI